MTFCSRCGCLIGNNHRPPGGWQIEDGSIICQSCAAQLDPKARDHGWLYVKGADGQWVTHRKLESAEIDEANDQAADMAVKQGTPVRAG